MSADGDQAIQDQDIDQTVSQDAEVVQSDHGMSPDELSVRPDDPSPSPENQPEEREQQPEAAGWDAIMSAVGDIPEDDEIISRLTPRQIAKLPAEARGIVRMAIARSNKEYSRRAEAQEAKKKELDERADRIKNDARRLLDERAKMAEVFSSAELKKYLDDAKSIDPKKLDLLTREGRAAFLQREAAEGLRKISEPITKAALRAQREQKYRSFRDAHPHMSDKTFRDEVLALGKQQEQTGAPIQLEDAYNRVLLRRQREKNLAQREQRRRVRAESMKHVGKRTVSSNKAPEPFTPEKRKQIRKKGYQSKSGQKFFGETAVAMYLREHPEDLSALREQQKKRRARR